VPPVATFRSKHGGSMKRLSQPRVPGNTEWERFDNAVGMLLNAPKQAFAKQEKKLKRTRDKKRAAKKGN